MTKIFFMTGMLLTMLLQPVLAVEKFAQYNPDGFKYEYTRSFISALSYLNRITQRWDKNPPGKKFADDKLSMIRLSQEYLVRDNADLRIAKNYLEKYVTMPNALIRKAADNVLVGCEQQININNQEKLMWQQWYERHQRGQPSFDEERTFVKSIAQLSRQRKQSQRHIINAAMLNRIILKSERNKNEKGLLLALSQSQRDRLINKLDTFARSYNSWGIKPGQNAIEASVSILREILEDSYYQDLDS